MANMNSMDTWKNLVELKRGDESPDWMNCKGSDCFDGIGHPIEQAGDIQTISGCNKDGCNKSDIGSNMPF